jgi:hypothetical protein
MRIPLAILAAFFACRMCADIAIADDKKETNPFEPKNLCHEKSAWEAWD